MTTHSNLKFKDDVLAYLDKKISYFQQLARDAENSLRDDDHTFYCAFIRHLLVIEKYIADWKE